MTERAQEYMDGMDFAIGGKLIDPDSIFYGRAGHERMAREFGYDLNDFNEHDQRELLSASYGRLYVKHCNLKPILDAKEWIGIAKSRIKKEN